MRSSPSLHIAAFEEVFASTIANIWVFDGLLTRTLSTSEYGVDGVATVLKAEIDCRKAVFTQKLDLGGSLEE